MESGPLCVARALLSYNISTTLSVVIASLVMILTATAFSDPLPVCLPHVFNPPPWFLVRYRVRRACLC